MTHAFSSRRRGGYSLTVVLLFLWAAVYRTTASFLRVETARVKRNDLDNGMLNALALALWYLEKNPGLSRITWTYGITVPVNPNNPNNTEGLNFTATFTPVTLPNGSTWSINVVPGYYPTATLPGP